MAEGIARAGVRTPARGRSILPLDAPGFPRRPFFLRRCGVTTARPRTQTFVVVIPRPTGRVAGMVVAPYF